MNGPLKALALWLRPDIWAERVSDLTPGRLAERGIKAVILDLDNTLLPWKSDRVPEENLRWAEDLRREGIRIFVLSNTTKPGRMKAICAGIGAGWIHPAAKPNRRSFLRAARILELEPREIAVVGDQLFTDMLGGRLAGMYLVLVRPISSEEFAGTRLVSRPAERLLKKYMQGPF